MTVARMPPRAGRAFADAGERAHQLIGALGPEREFPARGSTELHAALHGSRRPARRGRPAPEAPPPRRPEASPPTSATPRDSAPPPRRAAPAGLGAPRKRGA